MTESQELFKKYIQQMQSNFPNHWLTQINDYLRFQMVHWGWAEYVPIVTVFNDAKVFSNYERFQLTEIGKIALGLYDNEGES